MEAKIPIDGLLITKYSKPEINRYLISRLRLHQKLNRSMDSKLTMVIAPAGYGKTTAVLDWLKVCDLPAAWLSLDSYDSNSVAFWQYVCTALDRIHDGISGSTEYVFSSRELLESNVHINMIIDRLQSVPTDFLLILDDLHFITEPSILKGLSYLIDYMPSKMHLIITSRTEPELGLARHRLKWQIQKVEEKDLRFDEEEVFRFYEARGHILENKILKRVEDYTEGWAAAMVAVAMAMEDMGSKNDSIAALARSGRDISQYLKEEVFCSWQPEKQSFALKTSILDTFTEELCNAVTEKSNGRGLLKEINEGSGFLITLEADKGEYRYHPLFKDFLYEQLLETDPLEPARLQRNAAYWYQAHGFTPEAIEFLLRSGSFKEAFELIEHQIDYLINRNDFGRLLAWIERLPDQYRESSFKIAVIYAAYHAQIEDYDRSRQWIERMKELREGYPYASGPEWNDYSQSVCAAIEANLLIREGKMEFAPLVLSAVESGGGKYYKMPEYNDFNLSDIYFYRCPINRIIELLKASSEKYNRMVESYRMMISQNPGYAPLAMGEYLYESDRLEEALPYLLKAQEEAREAKCPGALVPAMANIARIKRAKGDFSGAFAVLAECENQLSDVGKPHWNYLLNAFRCRLFAENGYLKQAQEWASSSKLTNFTALSKIREFELIVYVRVLILSERIQDAEILLHRLLVFTEENNRLHSRVEVLNLLTLLSFGNHRTRLAFKYFDESLGIGLKEGYLRSYLDELFPMAQILRAYIKSRGKQAEDQGGKERKVFAAALLKKIRGSVLQTGEARDKAAAGMADKILEQLTEQEMRVFELVANAATNQEICETLGISLRTVKTHTGNIYGKLGLKNRAQCARLARELGLI